MLFYTQLNGKTLEEFEEPNHKMALFRFLNSNRDPNTVLRDYQHYIVNDETIRSCEVWASLDCLRNK